MAKTMLWAALAALLAIARPPEALAYAGIQSYADNALSDAAEGDAGLSSGELAYATGEPAQPTLYFPTDNESGQGFWGLSKEGWFWYQKMLEEKRKREEEERLRAEREKPKREIPPPETPKSPELTPEYLDSLTAEELRDLGTRAKEYAVGKPTRENVYRYIYIQKFMVDKSDKFQKTWQVVLLEHPELVYPENVSVSDSSRPVYNTVQEKLANKAIKDMSEKAALLFFYDPECPYCKAESEPLMYFETENKWYVKRVNIREDRVLAQKFGVQEVPDFWVVYRNPDDTPFYHRVRTGYMSAKELEEALLFMYENVIMSQELNPKGPWKKDGQVAPAATQAAQTTPASAAASTPVAGGAR